MTAASGYQHRPTKQVGAPDSTLMAAAHYNPLSTAHCLLRTTAHCPLFAAHHIPTTHYPLPVTHSLTRPLAHSPQPTATHPSITIQVVKKREDEHASDDPGSPSSGTSGQSAQTRNTDGRSGHGADPSVDNVGSEQGSDDMDNVVRARPTPPPSLPPARVCARVRAFAVRAPCPLARSLPPSLLPSLPVSNGYHTATTPAGRRPNVRAARLSDLQDLRRGGC